MKKKLRKLSIVTTLAVMFMSQVSCDAKKNEEKVYQIATETSFAPFAYLDETGEYIGIDLDIFNAIAENQKINFEYQHLGFESSCAALETKQVDGAICCLSIKEERKEKYDFSDPYYESSVVTVVGSGSDIEELSDLDGKKIGAKMCTDADKYATDISNEYGAEVTLVEDFATALLMLQSGTVDAIVEDSNVVDSIIEKDNSVRKIGDEGYVANIGFAVAKGENKELLEKFNTGLENIIESGEYDNILEKYIS